MTFEDNFCFVPNHPSTSHIFRLNAGSRIFEVRLELGVSGRMSGVVSKRIQHPALLSAVMLKSAKGLSR